MDNFDKNIMSSFKTVAEIRERGNFQTIKNEFGEAKLRNLLLKLYPKYSITEIETITNIPDATLDYWFKLLKIPSERWHIRIFSRVGNKNYEDIVKKRNWIRKKFTVKMTQDLAYLIGFALGDGAIQKYTVEVFNKDMGLYRHLYRIIKTYGAVEEKALRDYDLWTLRLNSIKIANLVKRDKKLNEETINYIFKRKNLANKFIAAFWDAEGSVARRDKYFHIYLYNTNEYLIHKIGVRLKAEKIDYSIHSRFDSGREYTFKGRVIKARKIMHRISIPKNCSLTWAKEIGIHMEHSKKKQIVKEILSLNK